MFFPAYDATCARMPWAISACCGGCGAVALDAVLPQQRRQPRQPRERELRAWNCWSCTRWGRRNLNDRHARWNEVPKGPDGVAVGYIDEDVYEVARASPAGRWRRAVSGGSEGVSAADGAVPLCRCLARPLSEAHPRVEFSAQPRGRADAEEVLDLLARHRRRHGPSAPRLCGGFLQMIPMGAVVERLVAVFLAAADAPDQMAQVLRALVADPAFAAPPAKLRRPFEFWRRSIAPRGPRSRGRRTAGTGS